MQNAKKIAWSVLAGLALLAMVATPVLGAAYYCDVAAVNSSGVSYTMLPLMCDLSTKYLAANGYMTATGLDTRVESGAVPHMLSDGKLLYARALVAGSSNLSEFTTGNTALSSFSIMTGYNGYITVLDNAQLEPGNNFEFEWKGYLDTSAGSDKYLIFKEDAIEVYVSAAGDVTSAVSTVATSQVAAGNADCLVYWTGAAWLYSGVHGHQRVGYLNAGQLMQGGGIQFTPAVPQGATITNAYITFNCSIGRNNVVVNSVLIGEDTDNAAVFANLADYQARRGTIVGGANDNNITTASVNWNGMDAWVGGTDYNSPDISSIVQEIVNRPGWVSGNGMVIFWDDHAGNSTAVNNTERVASSFDGVPANAPVLHISYVALSATATGISSGERRVVAGADTADLTIEVYDENDILIDDGTIALGGVSVPNNANPWYINRNNAMPYMEYLKITTAVGGVSEKLWFQPNDFIHGQPYTTGTATFTNGSDAVVGAGTSWTSDMDGSMIWSATDLIGHVVDSVTDATHLTLTANYSGAGGAGHSYVMAPRIPDRDTGDGLQDGAITWGANPSGVSVYADALAAVVAGGGGVVTPPPDVASEINEPEGMYPTEEEMSGEALVWLYPVVSDAAQQTDTPIVLIWYLICAVYVLLSMAAIHRFVPNMLLTGIGGLVAMGSCVAMAFLPSWFIILAVLFVIAIVVMERAVQI